MLPVLHPLEPARRHASGIGKDVGEHHDAAGGQEVVGRGLDRGVGRLDHDRGADRRRIGAGDHAAERRRNQHVAVGREEFRAGDRLAAAEADQPAGVGPRVPQQFEHVEAAWIVKGVGGIAHRDDPTFGVVEILGGVGADVAKALDCDPRAGNLPAEAAEQLERQRAHAAAGGLLAAGEAVELDRLAGDAGRREAVVLAVLVHDPGHHVGRCAHVGRRDVDVGAKQVVDGVDELPRHPLQFAERAVGRRDRHAPLCAAEGDIDDRGLPGHQGRQRPHVIEVYLGVVAQPPFERPSGVVVLHAVADECRDFPRIPLDRQLHPNLPLRRQQEPPHALRQVELGRRPVEIDPRGFVGMHGRGTPAGAVRGRDHSSRMWGPGLAPIVTTRYNGGIRRGPRARSHARRVLATARPHQAARARCGGSTPRRACNPAPGRRRRIHEGDRGLALRPGCDHAVAGQAGGDRRHRPVLPRRVSPARASRPRGR